MWWQDLLWGYDLGFLLGAGSPIMGIFGRRK